MIINLNIKLKQTKGVSMSKLYQLVQELKQARRANQSLRPVSAQDLKRLEKCGDLSSFVYSNGWDKFQTPVKPNLTMYDQFSTPEKG